MSFTPEDFLSGLLLAAQEAQATVDEHLADYDGLLLDLLVADLGRLCRSAFDREDSALLDRCLGYLALALKEGDAAVQNAVAVSFVENAAPWDQGAALYIASWPGALRDEAERQQAAW